MEDLFQPADEVEQQVGHGCVTICHSCFLSLAQELLNIRKGGMNLGHI